MMPKPIAITLEYDTALQAITGRPSDPVVLSEGAPFNYLLFNLFQSYPAIERQYPPGALGFTVNGRRPDDDTVLHDGDVVSFAAVNVTFPTNPRDVLLMEAKLRRKLQALVVRHRLSHSVEAIERLIFEEREAQDFTRFLESVLRGAGRAPADVKATNEALELLSEAWNQLPHASLDGKSPAQYATELRAKGTKQTKPSPTPTQTKRHRGKRA